MIYLKKCCRFAESDKAEHNKIVRKEAHRLLNDALIQKGISESELEFSYGTHGKPFLKNRNDIHFNISHCNGLAMCAVADSPIGADAENIRNFSERVIKRCFTRPEADFVSKSAFPERAFFQLWTLKESYVKAIGTGISCPLKNAEFIIENNCIAAHTYENLSFAQIIIDNEFVCSICGCNMFSNRIYFMSYDEQISFDILNV